MQSFNTIRNYLVEGHLPRNIPDSVGKFWVLGDITPEHLEEHDYTLSEVLFETDLEGFAYQVMGGLDMSTLTGIFKSKNDGLKYMKQHHPEAYDYFT